MVFDKFADDGNRLVNERDFDISMDLMTAPEKDTESERLDALRRALDAEREKFTDATIKLGKERAKLEVITTPFCCMSGLM
jgi:hypothetical protein